MGLKKVTTSSVEVYKVKGETMKIAFNTLKQEHGFDNHHVEMCNDDMLSPENIKNGAIYKKSKLLLSKYVNNEISEYTVFGALYNMKPILKDESRLLLHNIVIKGTKQWETYNSFRLDSGVEVLGEVSTKENAIDKAKELALEYNKTINVVVSKRLVDMDGVIAIAEFMPYTCVDDTNIYVFWVYTVKVEEIEEDNLIEMNTEVDSHGQLSIKEELYGFVGRSIITDATIVNTSKKETEETPEEQEAVEDNENTVDATVDSDENTEENESGEENEELEESEEINTIDDLEVNELHFEDDPEVEDIEEEEEI